MPRILNPGGAGLASELSQLPTRSPHSVPVTVLVTAGPSCDGPGCLLGCADKEEGRGALGGQRRPRPVGQTQAPSPPSHARLREQLCSVVPPQRAWKGPAPPPPTHPPPPPHQAACGEITRFP